MKLQAQLLATQAKDAQKAGDFVKADAMLKRALAIEPQNRVLRLTHAESLFGQKKFLECAEVLHQMHIDSPDDHDIWRHCAIAYIKLGEFEMAEKFLMKRVAADPTDHESWMNLCLTAGSSAKHSDSIFYAMQALQLRPLDASSHNNLGTALLTIGRIDDALVSFETARTLQPDNLDALSNTATALSMLGRPSEALEIYHQCLKKAPAGSEFALTLRYRMSYDYLRIGDLKNGWECYDYGFIPTDVRGRNPRRQFDVPQWDGRPLNDKTLMVWREQGLGDELMFFSLLGELQTRCANLIVECDERLVATMARSFPGVVVRPQAIVARELRPLHNDFDYHLPAGSMMRFFRSDLKDFERSKPYIVPHADRRQDFLSRLAQLPNRIKVGVAWRSGNLSVERNSSYVPVADLESLLQLKNVDFVNLQYGDCSSEIAKVEEHFGVTIHHWPDLDLRDDLEGVFALMSCLDHVVTAKTSVSEMAPAVGVPTSIFYRAGSWTMFGQPRYMLYPNVDVYSPTDGETLGDAIPRIADALRARYSL